MTRSRNSFYNASFSVMLYNDYEKEKFITQFNHIRCNFVYKMRLIGLKKIKKSKVYHKMQRTLANLMTSNNTCKLFYILNLTFPDHFMNI